MFYFLIYTLIVYVSCKYTQHIKFKDDGSFKITQITDIHYGEDNEMDALCNRLQLQNLKLEKPDFVVFTGDMVSDYTKRSKNEGFFKTAWENYTQPVTSVGVPYAYIFGNHDVGNDLSRDEIIELDQTNPYSMTEKGPNSIHGTTNYFIPIYDEKDEKMEMILWFFDSMNNECLNVTNTWGCVHPDVIKWYVNKSKELNELNNNKTIKGIAFLHIPPPEFFYGTNIFDISGNHTEEVSCPRINTGLITAMIEQNNILGVYVGHNHQNDYTLNYYGINLSFGAKTGYSGYGEVVGTRAIVLYKNESCYSYIRDVNGEILSENYRKDINDFGQISCPPKDEENNKKVQNYTFIIIMVFSSVGVASVLFFVAVIEWKRRRQNLTRESSEDSSSKALISDCN